MEGGSSTENVDCREIFVCEEGGASCARVGEHVAGDNISTVGDKIEESDDPGRVTNTGGGEQSADDGRAESDMGSFVCDRISPSTSSRKDSVTKSVGKDDLSGIPEGALGERLGMSSVF